MADPRKIGLLPEDVTVEDPGPVSPSPFYLGPSGGLGITSADGGPDTELPAELVETSPLMGYLRPELERVRSQGALGATPPNAGTITDSGPPRPAMSPPGMTPRSVQAPTPELVPQDPYAPPPPEPLPTTLPLDATYPRGTENAGQPVPLENQGRNLQNQSTDLKERSVDKQANAELGANEILSAASGAEADIWTERRDQEKKLLDPIRAEHDTAIEITRQIRENGAFSQMTGGQIAATFLVAFLSGFSSRYKGDEVTNILKGVVEQKVAANDKLMAQLKEKLGDERASLDAAVGMGLNALIKETDEKLKNVKDEQILSKWMMQRAELKDAAAAYTYAADARIEARSQRAIENAQNWAKLSAKSKGGGGGGGAGNGPVDPTSIAGFDGVTFSKDGKAIPFIDIAKGTGSSELSEKVRATVLTAKAFADSSETIDWWFGYTRNLVNDEDKQRAAQLGASAMSRMIQTFPRMSDQDMKWVERTLGPLTDPQQFLSVLNDQERRRAAHTARDLQIRTAKDLVNSLGQGGYSLEITGKAMGMEGKSRDNDMPSRKEMGESLGKTSADVVGGRVPRSQADAASLAKQRVELENDKEELIDSEFIREADALSQNADPSDLVSLKEAIDKKLASIEDPVHRRRTELSLQTVYARIQARTKKAEGGPASKVEYPTGPPEKITTGNKL